MVAALCRREPQPGVELRVMSIASQLTFSAFSTTRADRAWAFSQELRRLAQQSQHSFQRKSPAARHNLTLPPRCSRLPLSTRA